jgi:hypothetical protein
MKLFGPLLLVLQYFLTCITIHVAVGAPENLGLSRAGMDLVIRTLVLLLLLVHHTILGILARIIANLLRHGPAHLIGALSLLLLQLDLLFQILGDLGVLHELLQLLNRDATLLVGFLLPGLRSQRILVTVAVTIAIMIIV